MMFVAIILIILFHIDNDLIHIFRNDYHLP